MAKKESNKKSWKIFGATAMSIFTLVAVFTATIAWFALNKNVTGSAMTINAKESGTDLSSLKAYKCILDKSKTNDLVFDGTSQYESSGSSESYSFTVKIEMLDYSELASMSPILFLFDFTVTENNTSTWTVEAKDIHLTGKTATSEVASTPAATLPLSNFISFKSGYIQHSQVGTSNSSIVKTNAAGDSIIEIKPSSVLTQTASFASYNENGANHAAKYPFEKNIDVYKGADNDTTKIHYLAVVMDYNQDVIFHWKRDYLDSYSGNRIAFTCDFSLTI